MKAQPSHPMILVRDLAIGYQKDAVLLDHLKLRVEHGELIALIGRNGTGKSTLLKTILGLLPPLAGELLLSGSPLTSYSALKRAQLVSYVASGLPQLPSLSVEEVASLGRMPHTGWRGQLSRIDKEEVSEALRLVGMSKFRNRKLDQLSDGERQRAMIARALAQDTPLILLDEPAAFLDIPNTHELITLLTQFRSSGKAIIYSTHDLELAMQCADKVWVIHEDHIFEGSPEDLGLGGLFSRIFSSSGIAFDEATGRFLFSRGRAKRICLLGEHEQALIWTRRLLRRLEYQIDPLSQRILRVEPAGDWFRWQLEEDGREWPFEDLYNLARFLIQVS